MNHKKKVVIWAKNISQLMYGSISRDSCWSKPSWWNSSGSISPTSWKKFLNRQKRWSRALSTSMIHIDLKWCFAVHVWCFQFPLWKYMWLRKQVNQMDAMTSAGILSWKKLNLSFSKVSITSFGAVLVNNRDFKSTITTGFPLDTV